VGIIAPYLKETGLESIDACGRRAVRSRIPSVFGSANSPEGTAWLGTATGSVRKR
jgi:hypothetical protein